jgi:hypothetical protein
MQSVDHTKLHNTIVQKAFDATSAFLTKEQTQQLVQNKINRARSMLEAPSRLPVLWHTER